MHYFFSSFALKPWKVTIRVQNINTYIKEALAILEKVDPTITVVGLLRTFRITTFKGIFIKCSYSQRLLLLIVPLHL